MIEAIIISYAIELLIAGIIVYVLQYIIPIATYKLPLQFAGLIMICSGVFYSGKESERSAWEVKMVEVNLQIASLEARAAEVNTHIITEFYPKIQYIDRVEQQVVTEFVSIESDNKCTVNEGFVRLHDAVVRKEIIQSIPSDKNDTEVKLSEIGHTVKENYQTCHRTTEQLISLQKWIREQEKIWNSKQ